MTKPVKLASLFRRSAASAAAIFAISVIFGAKALEYERIAAGMTTNVAALETPLRD